MTNYFTMIIATLFRVDIVTHIHFDNVVSFYRDIGLSFHMDIVILDTFSYKFTVSCLMCVCVQF